MSVSDRVVEVLEESGLEDDDIAEKMGKSQSTINRWRNKKTKNFGQNTLKEIANAFDVQYEWLKYGTGSKNDPQSNDPKVQYAGSVDLPEDGQLSKDHMKQLLGQIESIARILKDSL